MTDRRGLLSCVWVGAMLACGGAAADHEKLGDRAYMARDFAEALAEYRLASSAQPSPDIHAKTGAAALHAGDLLAAAEAYRALAASDPDRTVEASDGLERVALAAVDGGDREALQLALEGLKELAQGRALGRFARELAGGAGSTSREAREFLPIAAAVATDTRTQDSLIFEYGRALARAGDCEGAVPVMEGISRREVAESLVDQAALTVSRCALRVGREELDAGHPGRAEDWFRRAVAGGRENAFTRAAYIGLGDVMVARGEFIEAVSAYQRALEGGTPTDSISLRAMQRLNDIADAGIGTTPGSGVF